MVTGEDRGLASRLVALLRANGRAIPATRELDAALARAVDGARATWPDIDLSDDDFLVHLASHLPDDRELAVAIDELCAADLYLACGCARQDPRALAHFERQFLTPIGWPPGHQLGDSGDEVRQILRVRLLLGKEGEKPRIASYGGRGALGAWVRVAATRVAVSLRQPAHRQRDVRDDEIDLRSPMLDPELEYLKARYSAELSDALRGALGSLPARSAALLQLHYQERMTVDAIGKMYGASGRTVQRWLAGARKSILGAMRETLRDRLGLSDPELDSLVGLVRSRLHVSILRHLAARAAPADDR